MNKNEIIVSVTELHLKKSFLSFILFIVPAIINKNKASKAKGNLYSEVSSPSFFIHRTLTCWSSKEVMMDFVQSKQHKRAMKLMPKIAKPSYVHTYIASGIPSLEEALEKLKKQGRQV